MKKAVKILKYISFGIIGLLIMVLLWFAFWYWYEKGEDVNCILPNNYEGGVILLFDVKNGEEEKYSENNKRIYEIPENGVLKTKFDFQNGKRYKIKYFYKSGKELRYLWPSDMVWGDTINLKSVYKDSIYTYKQSFGGSNLWFLIGKPKDIEKNYKILNEMSDRLPPNTKE